jgi:hypothetical protein
MDIMDNFVFATFTFGEFYHAQTNRLIESSLLISEDKRPKIMVITDDCNSIISADNVICKNVSTYDPKHMEFAETYDGFDFSVKRLSILQSLTYGYTNICLIDNDVIFIPERYNNEIVSTFFEPNVVSGPVIYLYSDHLLHGALLGNRFRNYMSYFDNIQDTSNYMDMLMPEDCITYFSFPTIEIGKEYVNIWEKCRDYKYEKGLNTSPVGNIDEICYAAVQLNMEIKPSHISNSYNMYYADHVRYLRPIFKDKKLVSFMETINSIDEFYNYKLTEVGSDIYEHMPTLTRYAKECEHITEFGSRKGSSTVAMIKANSPKMVSYDMYSTEDIDRLVELAKLENYNFEFKVQNVIENNFTIEETDLLFIDTLHTYPQLIQELRMHSLNVKKYIIMHDTQTFKNKGESGNLEKGLMDAVEEFINENNNWEIEKIYTNNNGLTILKRK